MWVRTRVTPKYIRSGFLIQPLSGFPRYKRDESMKFNEIRNSILERISIRNKTEEGLKPNPYEIELYKVTINSLVEGNSYEGDEEALQELRKRFEAVLEENPDFVLQLADYARNEMYLREISQVLLVLAANNDRTKQYIRDWFPTIISSVDELCKIIDFSWNFMVNRFLQF